jgi:hypothetical protein
VTAAHAASLRAELARLLAAQPSRIPAFAAGREARRLELEAALAGPIEPAPDPRDEPLERLLRSAGGGDRFDRGARARLGLTRHG